MENNLFECLKTIDEECAVVEKRSNGNYHIAIKKHMINNDGSDAGWLYTDVSNARLNDDNRYLIEPIKENKIGNREYRRSRKNDKLNKKCIMKIAHGVKIDVNGGTNHAIN